MSYPSLAFDGEKPSGRCLCTAVVLVLMALSTAAAKDAWPQFRGPEGDGVAREASETPLTWSPEEHVAWRAELPGSGWSSPVIGTGKVYLSAAIPTETDGEFELSLLILDQATGKLEKTVALLKQDQAKIHDKNSHASPTVLLDGDRVYVHFGYQGTACTTREGEKLWEQRELTFNPLHGNGGSPVLVDDKLIFTCDGNDDPYVAAIDAATGEIAWKTPRPTDANFKFSFSTPTPVDVAGNTQVVAPGSNNVMALDPADGHVIWQVKYDGFSVIPKPVVADGLVMVATGYGRTKLMAIRPDGEGDVTDTHVAWEGSTAVPNTPSGVASDGRVFMVSDNGIATCYDAASGDLIWRQRLDGNYSSSLTLIRDRIYATNEEGLTTVYEAGPAYVELAKNDLGERTLSSLAVDGRALYLRTANALYRIED